MTQNIVLDDNVVYATGTTWGTTTVHPSTWTTTTATTAPGINGTIWFSYPPPRGEGAVVANPDEVVEDLPTRDHIALDNSGRPQLRLV